jgi:hypothetical protein
VVAATGASNIKTAAGRAALFEMIHEATPGEPNPHVAATYLSYEFPVLEESVVSNVRKETFCLGYEARREEQPGLESALCERARNSACQTAVTRQHLVQL